MKYISKSGALFILIVVAVYGLLYYKHAHPGPKKKVDNTVKTDANKNPEKNYVTEERWIVDETARSVVNILIHAKGGKKPTEENFITETTFTQGKFLLGVDSLPDAQPVIFQSHIWGPEGYAPFITNLMQAWKLEAPAPGKADETLLVALANPDSKTLVREGRRISDALAENPLDPGVNDQAALLIGVFALREANGNFSDTRAELCRITAHLAVARALQPEAGNTGKMASVVLLALAGRQADSMNELAPLEAALPAWGSAMKLRNTGDWRALPEPGKATLLEQLEWFRAAVNNADANLALRLFPKAYTGDRPDWAHIIMQGNFSVENGHRFAKPSLFLDMTEIASTWKLLSGNELHDKELVEQLNASPLQQMPVKNDSPLEVLGWADWAAYYQRALCHDGHKTILFLRSGWGVPEVANAYQKEFQKNFSSLTLWPVLEARNANERKTFESVFPACTDLCNKQPQLVTVSNWAWLKNAAHFQVMTTTIPPVRNWFRTEIPFGTVYDLEPRMFQMNALKGRDGVVWNPMRELAPWNCIVLWGRLWNLRGDHPSQADVTDGYSTIKDYNLLAMYHLLETQRRSAAEYMKTVENICKIDPDYLFVFADSLVEAGRPEEAARVYREGFEKATDRVMVSNSVRWIVDYDMTHGMKEEAEKIAAEAAAVYSSTGLETMALLKERGDELDAAERYFTNIAERYRDFGPLAAFYRRNATKVPAYTSKADILQRSVFPSGMEKAALAGFSGEPTDGIIAKNSNYALRKNGLQADSVIVAIEGVRVHNLEQYGYVRDMNADPNFVLIVWYRGAYQLVKIYAPYRNLGGALTTYNH